MGRPSQFSEEVRQRTVRLVLDHQHEYSSQWAGIGAIAPKIGCTPETLRRWVRQAEIDTGKRSGVSSEEQQRIKELEREVKELRRSNEILT